MRTQAKGQSLPPGPPRWPLLGNVVQFRRNQLRYLLELEHRYGRMATIFIGRTPVVLLFRPEHVRYVLVQHPRNFTSREVSGGLIFGNLLVLSLLARSFSKRATRGLEDFLGDGLLTTDGELHDWHRRILQPGFSKTKVAGQGDLVVRYTQDAIERWRGVDEIDLAQEMQQLILRITGRILFDVDLQGTGVEHIIEGLLAQPVGLLDATVNYQGLIPFGPYRKRQALLRQAHDVIYQIIDRRLADDLDHGDVLSLMLNRLHHGEGGRLTRREIRDEHMSLLAAGHETSTNTILWTLYLLDRHPAVLRRVIGELRSVLGARSPSAADLHELRYLDQVVRESMRLYPSAWTQGRRSVNEFELDGYRFPPGTLFMFSQWVLHRLPDVWGDPDVFRPERWNSVHHEHDDTRWAYFPFGAGPRSCLGMPLANLEIRLILATILQQLVPVLVPGHVVAPLPLITLRSKFGLRVSFVPASSFEIDPAIVANQPLNRSVCAYHVSAETGQRERVRR